MITEGAVSNVLEVCTDAENSETEKIIQYEKPLAQHKNCCNLRLTDFLGL
jgi:hypothetical protein